ncbi:dihydroorotase [Lichenifustis flavocetrariae]|uniref:Amidohydrolase family protein n=1 Tax=Lichenifustis flavocetrariae TaxID=2949735 RepID=A0AA42CR73_9HYPH|nr:amidohydrolase family protein [Lichenifustis flavocetrariae]MCW6512170.1 amidohydrolase family protein [Lichenifustis flavocetrariae]
MDTVISGTIVTGREVLPGGWLAIRDGRIAAIGCGEAPAAASHHDAGDALVLPGVIDGQTHAGSFQGLPGLASTTRSAVAGGVTTIVDMPYDNPHPLDSIETLREKVAAIETWAHCNVALYATVMPGQGTDAVDRLIEGGIVAFKISSFESSPTRFPRIPSDLTLDLFETLAGTHIPLGLHNEDQEIVRSRVARLKEAGQNGIAAHSGSRPPAAEAAATAHFLELGAAAGAHAHIVHLTTNRGFQLVENYRRDGFRATGELCVHYLWFDPVRDGAELGARMKVNPPIRPGQSDALWAEIAAGRVAFVSSDHSSWPIDNKLTPSIFDAGAGVPGLETLLPAFFTGARKQGFDAARATVEQLCERPARFFGLWPQKGEIRVGADADLAIFSLGPTPWRAAEAHDELNWSPFEDRIFDGHVSRTYVGGKLAWDGSVITNREGDGRFLPRGSSRWFDGRSG